MGDNEARRYWNDTGPLLLIGGLVLPPVAWLLDLQVSYAAVKWACAHDQRGVILAIPLGSLTLLAAAGAMSWSCWTRVRTEAHETGGDVEDRSYMLALTGLGLNAIFALLVITSMAARVLSPCQ